ncbi:hypothetical protein FXO38_12385 [Capsicum annuum]|uniref:Uncharacterized protein n=1 Tax=Capsicum annuum TaxID=4072 RepID=A0A2G2Y8W2_CAPAN|nr:hypothetical protein FXO37_34861 [Capsicum annuum]KAF3659931.1 hypothetical protein FXO38_12385 [Capsicum annuum]PHT66119.1 hypothetical protein T459_30544 [Capsicum annuum]
MPSQFRTQVTLVHHTHSSLQHYDSSEWDHLRGALVTVDRDYGVLNKIFQNITDTRVASHILTHITLPCNKGNQSDQAIARRILQI